MENILEQNRKTIGELCSRHHVKNLYAFGSVLTNKFGEKSDVDFVVAFENMKLEDYADNYYDLKFALEDLFKRDVDLLEQQAMTNPYFNKKVEAQKQLIYGR